MNIKTTDGQLDKLLSSIDTDTNGFLNFQEFKRFMADIYFRKGSQRELEALFKRLDADGSGYISTQEIRDVMLKMGRNLTREDAEEMVRNIDGNADGKYLSKNFASYSIETCWCGVFFLRSFICEIKSMICLFFAFF